MVNGDKQENKGKNAWWAPALEIFSQVSGYIVTPIVVALVAGKWLDGHFGTKPWIFLGMAGLGFVITIVGIFKVVKKYSEKLKEINDGK